MAARMQTQNFANLIKPGLRKVIISTLKDSPKEFRQLFNVITGENPGGQSGRHYFDDLQVAPLGTYIALPQGNAIQYDRIKEVGTVRYTPFAYALGARITHQMWVDELYSVMAKIYRLMAKSALHQMEVQAFRPLNFGFGTTGAGTGFTAAGYDALALFSTAHPLARGGTAGNRATTDMDLSITAVEVLSDLMELTVDEAGMPDPRRPETIVVPPKLRWVAREITQSELKPYTGNNEVTPLGGSNPSPDYMVVHYLADEDSWFMRGTKADSDVNIWIREDPMYDAGDDFDTKDVKVSGMFRIASGHGDWRNWAGSQGA